MNHEHRAVYLATATLVLLFLGLIYAWSIFRGPFGELFPAWSVSQMSLTFTISMICFCLGGFAGGLMSKRMSAKARMLVSAVMLLVGFLAVSAVDASDPGASLKVLYLFYGVFGGAGVGIAYNTIIGTVSKWYSDKVGLASGIMLMGFGLGGLVLGFAVNLMIGSMGVLAVFRILGIAIAAVCVLAAFVIRDPKAASGSVAANGKGSGVGSKDESSGASASEGNAGAGGPCASSAQKSFTAIEMLKTARFWLFTCWVIMLNAAGLLVINSAASISVAFGGAAVLGLIVSLFNGAGRIVAGNNFDRFGRKAATLVNSAFMLGAGILLVLGSATGAYVFIIGGLVLVGLAYGGNPAITSAYINRAFGPDNFPTNFSIANFSLIPAATIGPMVSSALLEASGGDYGTSFYAIVGFAAAALVLWVLLNLASKRQS